MLARKLLTIPIVAVALAAAAPASAAERIPDLGLIPGVVAPPPLGLSLHNDVVTPNPGRASASAFPVAGAVERITTPDGYTVTVETSTGYVADPTASAEIVGFVDSLLHGAELNGLTLFIARPEELKQICPGAAACYFPSRATIFFVPRPSFGGLPTSYLIVHEYGHRVAQKRPNPPFQGGALDWGTKRWASHEQVCRKHVQGLYAPGAEQGSAYFRNPGEAFAEAYAWYHYGSGVVGWEFTSSLRPDTAALEAIERDVLEPWVPTKSALEGQLRPRKRDIYPLRVENDGWLKVRMTGGGDLDVGLLNSAGRFVAVSVRPGSARESFRFLVCGERRLKLVVENVQGPGDYGLQLLQP